LRLGCDLLSIGPQLEDVGRFDRELLLHHRYSVLYRTGDSRDFAASLVYFSRGCYRSSPLPKSRALLSTHA
jgi:hypothetical protein